MKNFFILVLISGVFVPLAMAQMQQRGRRASEAQETLRFLRLAETKKNLDFSDEKLLSLNEILDDFEKQRFDLTRERQKLHRLLLTAEDRDDAESQHLLDGYLTNKKKMLESEFAMVDRVKAILTPKETLSFMVFYERFQRDVQRKVRMLQKRGRGMRDGNNRP